MVNYFFLVSNIKTLWPQNKDNFNNRFGAQINYFQVIKLKRLYTNLFDIYIQSLILHVLFSYEEEREHKIWLLLEYLYAQYYIFLALFNPAEISRRIYNAVFSDTARHLLSKWQMSIILYFYCPLSTKSKFRVKRSLFFLQLTWHQHHIFYHLSSLHSFVNTVHPFLAPSNTTPPTHTFCNRYS